MRFWHKNSHYKINGITKNEVNNSFSLQHSSWIKKLLFVPIACSLCSLCHRLFKRNIEIAISYLICLYLNRPTFQFSWNKFQKAKFRIFSFKKLSEQKSKKWKKCFHDLNSSRKNSFAYEFDIRAIDWLRNIIINKIICCLGYRYLYKWYNKTRNGLICI